MCVLIFLPYISPNISSHTFKVGICLNVYTKIKFTSSSQEAFSIKIGVPIDKIKATLLKSTTLENFIVNLLRS